MKINHTSSLLSKLKEQTILTIGKNDYKWKGVFSNQEFLPNYIKVDIQQDFVKLGKSANGNSKHIQFENAEIEIKEGVVTSTGLFYEVVVTQNGVFAYKQHVVKIAATLNSTSGVYLMACDYEGKKLLKIGKSENVHNRYKSHLTSNPKAVLLGYIQTEKLSLEKALHKRFASKRYKNEWFYYDENILKFFRNHNWWKAVQV